MGQVKLADFIVPLLYFHRESLKKQGPSLNRNITRWVWTSNFLELFDSVDSILIETLLTVMVLMLAFRDEEPSRIVSIPQTYLTFKIFS